MQLFKRMGDQFDKLMTRRAFMEQYKKYPLFSDNLDEFDESRETVRELIDEYSEAEKESYAEWSASDVKEGF